LKITFLGTGTSQGVPLIACRCNVCLSDDARDKRLRTSIMIEDEGTTIVIDSGPDFRQQMLRYNVCSLDGLLFTHGHKDHTAGMDDVRAFNYIQNKTIDVYAAIPTQTILKREFQYIFDGTEYPGIPRINLNTISANEPFNIGSLKIQPFEVIHHKMPVLGFRIKNFTYITDANHIPEYSRKMILNSEILVLNALRKEAHISHFTLAQAIAESTQAKAHKTYLTHISHQLGLHSQVQQELPDDIFLAYDGLTITL
jgi:phosphoribosyl 1,2-cyclic phosphate phosphodiesterase